MVQTEKLSRMPQRYGQQCASGKRRRKEEWLFWTFVCVCRERPVIPLGELCVRLRGVAVCPWNTHVSHSASLSAQKLQVTSLSAESKSCSTKFSYIKYAGDAAVSNAVCSLPLWYITTKQSVEWASPEQNYCLQLPFPFDIFIVYSFRIVNLLQCLYNSAVKRQYLKGWRRKCPATWEQHVLSPQ